MPIATFCPTCQALYRLAEELAGKQVLCPKCQGRFVVPGLLHKSTPDPRPAAAAPAVPSLPLPRMDTSAPAPVQATAAAPANVPAKARPTPVVVDDVPERRSPRRARPEQPLKRRSKAWFVALVLVPIAFVVGLAVAGGFWISQLPNQMGQRVNAPARGQGRIAIAEERKIGPAVIEVAKPDGFRDKNLLVGSDPLEPKRRVPCKEYRVRLQAGQNYVIEMQSSWLDAVVRITDENGQERAESGAPRAIARIAFMPPLTGLFKIYASAQNGDLGNFELTIVREEPLPVIAPRPVHPIAVKLGPAGYINHNTIEDADGDDPVRKFPCKLYEVHLEAGQSYVIEMKSRNIDSYLRLTDADDRQLAEHDDFAVNNQDARIDFTPQAAGLYKIYATDCNNALGPYTLTIRRRK